MCLVFVSDGVTSASCLVNVVVGIASIFELQGYRNATHAKPTQKLRAVWLFVAVRTLQCRMSAGTSDTAGGDESDTPRHPLCLVDPLRKLFEMQITRGGKGLKVRSRPLCTTSLLTEEGSLVFVPAVFRSVSAEKSTSSTIVASRLRRNDHILQLRRALRVQTTRSAKKEPWVGLARRLPCLACRRLHPWRLRHPRGELRLAPSGGGARGVCGDDDQCKHIPGRLHGAPPRREGCLGRQEHRTRTRGKL